MRDDGVSPAACGRGSDNRRGTDGIDIARFAGRAVLAAAGIAGTDGIDIARFAGGATSAVSINGTDSARDTGECSDGGDADANASEDRAADGVSAGDRTKAADGSATGDRAVDGSATAAGGFTNHRGVPSDGGASECGVSGVLPSRPSGSWSSARRTAVIVCGRRAGSFAMSCAISSSR